MSLAFDDLPHHLKSCFLYLAATTLGERAGGRAPPRAALGGRGLRAATPRVHDGGGGPGVPQGAHLPVPGAVGAQGRGAGGQLRREPRQRTTDVLAPATVSRLAVLAAAPTADTSSSSTRSPEAAAHRLRLRGGARRQVRQQRYPVQDQGGRRPGSPQGQARARHPDHLGSFAVSVTAIYCAHTTYMHGCTSFSSVPRR
jgi:hypothetical protein